MPKENFETHLAYTKTALEAIRTVNETSALVISASIESIGNSLLKAYAEIDDQARTIMALQNQIKSMEAAKNDAPQSEVV